jgi:hypothetical protein
MFRLTSQFYKNPNVLFTQADKGNVVVALDRESYIEKMEEALNNTSTYNIVKNNPASGLERNLNKLLKNWLQKDYIEKQKHYTFKTSNCLPKIHKNNISYSIIVSSIGTALYPLATFLHKLIFESIPHLMGHVNNSFELYNSLVGREIPDSHILISLDVISLFMNVPTNLAIDKVRKRWSYIEKKKMKIPLDEFLSAVQFVLSFTFFSFNIYKPSTIKKIVRMNLKLSMSSRLYILSRYVVFFIV